MITAYFIRRGVSAVEIEKVQKMYNPGKEKSIKE